MAVQREPAPEPADTKSIQSQGIKSVEVAGRVLTALEQGRGPMGLSEVARGANLHPAKVHRYLASLIRTGLASQNPTSGLYDLGPASRRLGVEALRRTDAVSTVSAYAMELRDQTGHTANAGVWTDAGPTLVRWDTGAHALPIVVRLGSTLPLLDSAFGFVFLAYLPEAITREVMKAQQRQGTTRRASADEIREIRETTRRDRFARTTNQMIFGLAALAAPVFGPDGGLEVVLGLVLPSRLMSAADAKRLSVVLTTTAEQASAELGHRDS